MCGIAGILNGPDVETMSIETLRRMVGMIRHRGPDGYGLYRDEFAALGHARLSIIDIEGGAQPIHNEDESLWIVFNGEVFNYIELRAELQQRGHRFTTRSDTEVIVHGFEEYQDQIWTRLNGQFALALWDTRRRRLRLVRDHLGILPLYYTVNPHRVTFASETKALFAAGDLTPELNPCGIMQVFTRWGAAAPNTVFRGVRSVEPGTVLQFDENLQETRHTYWSPDFSESQEYRSLSADEAAEALEKRLTRAIELRLRADVPVGAYLSGGLDSSVIGSMIHRAESSPLQTFAICFENQTFDETPQQRRMAALLATDHHETRCGSRAIAETLPDVVWHTETPLMRTAPVPLFLLSELVRRNGMKVVLTGEGADEFLAGYHIFKEDKIRRFWARQPDSTARPALLARVYPYVIGTDHRHSRMWQEFFRRSLTDIDDPFYSHRIRWTNSAWSTTFLSAELLSEAEKNQPCGDLHEILPQGWLNWRPLARAQMVEIATFFSPYLLTCQGDRVAMAHGVEVRYPFLDPGVIDFCSRLPSRLKLRGLWEKAVLRRMASRRLPEDIWRRPKQPYRAPMTEALFTSDSPAYVDEMLSDRSIKRWGWVDAEAARRLVDKARQRAGHMSGEREEMALVGILTLQLLGYWFLDRLAETVQHSRRQLDTHRLDVLEDRVRPSDSIHRQAGATG